MEGSTNQYTIEGLEPNTMYNVTVQAKTQSGYHEGRQQMFRTEDARMFDNSNYIQKMGQFQTWVVYRHVF